MTHKELVIRSCISIYNEEGINQCESADRLVNTVPVTSVSPMRNSNTMRPDGRYLLECIDDQSSQGYVYWSRQLEH